ncbi:glycosyltransferase family 4 protein [Lentibacter algarum]|uniref:glycosyltransferase family 4 protein n=1 Tax=Lentibacter algarum TaxID=576131 RepID=UPI001C095CDD|nr:glycosyltransferase family 4 protein [Lentibacter algarum]MBU2983353.1 glycosyltransferase family 4 protein [Lentibacter algarum]
MAARLKVLILADECNPEWPSLPIVGYKYALEIAEHCDVTVATHVRNRENIEKAAAGLNVVYIDTEWLAAPMFKLARFLRGGEEVAWSTSMMMNYLPYLAFERGVWQHFKPALRAGEFDIVHRITPMSPTLPSYIASKVKVPFLIGPLNGNLDWPQEFLEEQAREKEKLRGLRGLYKYLPYARSTYRKAAAVLTAFEHTRADLTGVEDARIVMVPEIGFDPEIFHTKGAKPAGQRGDDGKLHFLYAGRLVPYKLPELPIRAFAASPALQAHHLHILGSGPEEERMRAVIAEFGLEGCVTMEGRKTQSEVADLMRRCDGFIFPSIRELGAGVVIEAMACGMHCLVADYGAPGALASEGRGDAVPIAQIDAMVAGFAERLEACAAEPAHMAECAKRAQTYADGNFTWAQKGAHAEQLYRAVIAGDELRRFDFS